MSQYPGIESSRINTSRSSKAAVKIKETIGIINNLKETIGIIKEAKAIIGIARLKEEPGITTHKTKTMRIIRVKNGRGVQGTCFISRKRGHKEKCWHHRENAHLRPELWNNTQNSPLIQNNMGNLSQDVRNQNNNTQS